MPLAWNYCTDEDIALRTLGDYTFIVPPWQVHARAIDGEFMPNEPFILTSATVDFEAQGIHAGHVIWLTQPRSYFRGDGDLLAVDGVNGHYASLRRLGEAPGRGQAPAPMAGLTNVEFTVLTFDPQIDTASFDLNKTLNIDPQVFGRRPQDLYNMRDLQQATVMQVVMRAYGIQVKTREGDFALKLEQLKIEYADLMTRIYVKWGESGLADVPSTGFPRVRARR